MEIPAPKAGVIAEVLVKVGDKVSRGSPLFSLQIEGEGDGAGATDAAPAAAPVSAAPPSAPAVAPSPPPKPAPAEAVGEPVAVTLPDVGDFHDIPVIEILVSPGDRVAVDQSLLTLESDKATMEIPSPRAGLVESVAVKIGDKAQSRRPDPHPAPGWRGDCR
jgi:pyruvate dehydrogenase E2 component (dihydrolipoamide acetyltransferase)